MLTSHDRLPLPLLSFPSLSPSTPLFASILLPFLPSTQKRRSISSSHPHPPLLVLLPSTSLPNHVPLKSPPITRLFPRSSLLVLLYHPPTIRLPEERP